MWKILVLTVCSLVVTSGLIAKEIPITKTIEIEIPNNQYSVVEFPFEFLGKPSFAPYVYKKRGDKKSEENYAIPKMVNKKTQVGTTKSSPNTSRPPIIEKRKNNKPIELEMGKNFIKFLPKIEGSTEIIVWGYKKFPIMIKLIIKEGAPVSNKHIKFIDYENEEKEAISFESDAHDRVIVKITKAMYLEELPKGYRKRTKNYSEKTEEGLIFELIQQYVGKHYMGEEYLVRNNGKDIRWLDSEMLEQSGVYGITFLNDVIKPDEETRLFVVREKVDE